MVHDLPANTSAAHLDCDLTGLQALSTLHILNLGCRLGDPEVVVGVGVNTNVSLGHGGCGRHGERVI